MIESIEDQRFLLAHAGEELVFLTGTLLAIPNQNSNEYRLETDNSVYSSKEYYFQCIHEDIVSLNINIGDTFDYFVRLVNCRFKILNNEQDIFGWRKLTCSLEEII